MFQTVARFRTEYCHVSGPALALLGLLGCLECFAQPIGSAEVAGKYIVTSVPYVQPDLSAFPLPDLSRFTPDEVRRKVPEQRDGRTSVGIASDFRLLDEAFQGDRGRDLRQRQSSDQPRVILIEEGAVSLAQVVDQLDDAAIAENTDGVVTLRLPLLVRPGAALIVDGRTTPTLRLSSDRGALIANAGRLFILNARVTSWNERSSQPSLLVAKHQFRPFITSYVRSETHVAGSTVEHLGFAAPSAYGFSLTSHPERNLGAPRPDWPTGILVGNEFRGLYYGFYAFEARDVAIVDNRYVDNIVYGIDPHDRSTRLVIARNSASGTVERHGIIGSRGITHSFIVDNVAFDNAGSGIMLDRQCSHNLVQGNKVHQNGQGIAIYESPSNVIRGNLVAFNTKSGVRIRNSVDVQVLRNTIVGQDDYALEVYAKQLDDHDRRVARGDTYDARVSATFSRNRVKDNDGLAKARNVLALRLHDVDQDLDVAAIAASLNATRRSEAATGDNTAFGQELKPLASQLKRVLTEENLMLEVRQLDR